MLAEDGFRSHTPGPILPVTSDVLRFHRKYLRQYAILPNAVISQPRHSRYLRHGVSLFDSSVESIQFFERYIESIQIN